MEPTVPATVGHTHQCKKTATRIKQTCWAQVVARAAVEINRVVRQRVMGKEEHCLLNVVVMEVIPEKLPLSFAVRM